MHLARRSFRTILSAALFLMATLATAAYAQTASSTPQNDLQVQADAAQAQINALRNEIEQLQIQLNNTTGQKNTLQNAVKTLDLNIQKLQKSITLTNTQITQKDREITRLSGGIATTSETIDTTRLQIGAALRNLSELDEEPLGAALLSGGSLSDFFDQAVTLGSLRDDLQNKILDLSSLKTTLTTNKTSAESSRKQLASLQSQLNQEKQSLAVARQSQNDLLTQTKNQESSYQSLIASKKAEEARFEDILYQLSVQLGTADVSDVPSAGSGILHWPLDSIYITQQFGKTSSSGRLYASGTHNGVDFRASLGTPVRAALTGVVQEINQGAVKNCQYGKWVLIKHANGLTTLYGHLSQINVTKGQTVSTGQVIGLSGDTGYATGPHLHLTVFASTAVSFKQYTCASGLSTLIPIVPVNGYLDPLAYLPKR